MALDLQARSMAAQVQANLDEYIETFQNGMKFVGVSSTDPLVSGATVSGYSDWAAGNIVLYSDKEYLLTATPNIAANWVKFGDDSGGGGPFAAGTGHDSAVLTATPNPEDPSVDRTNVASGNFSAVLAGSRNSVTGSEASSVGGRNTVSGNDAFAAGYHGVSTGENSFTAGYNNIAFGGSSFATGFQTETNGEASFTSGRKTEAVGDYSSAFGRSTRASGLYSSSEGYHTIASGEAAHVEGLGVASNDRSEASGKASHAEGWYTKAVGVASHTEGTDTVANGDYSHAEGDTTHTNGLGQHSEGVGTIATSASGNNGQHVAGRYNVETAGARVTGGGVRSSERANIEVLDWSGNLTIAGKMTVGAAPTNNMDVATKQYVDGAVAGTVTLAGNNRFTGQNTFTNTTICYPNLLQDGNGNAYVTTEDITEVVANPEVYGSEDTLTSLQVGDTKYIVPSGGGGSDSSVKLAIDLWSNGGWSTNKDVTGTVSLFTNLLSASGYSSEGVYAVLLGPSPEELDKLFKSEDQTEWENYFENLSDDHQCGFGYFNGEILIDSRFIQSFYANAWDAFTPMALILKVDDFDENNPAVDWFNNRWYAHMVDLTWADITNALDNGN